jgi:hypothetical protein
MVNKKPTEKREYQKISVIISAHPFEGINGSSSSIISGTKKSH